MKKILAFLSKPWVLIGFGWVVMVISVSLLPEHDADIVPGFGYGVLYGLGFSCTLDGFFQLWDHNKRSACPNFSGAHNETVETWFKTQCWVNQKILAILCDQWSDIPPIPDPVDDEPLEPF